VWRRVSPYPAFTFFDAPDRTECVVDRSRTNSPLQALTLLNSDQFVEAALGLAGRILVEERDGTEAERLERAFVLLLAREPTPEESQTLLAVLDRQAERLRADPRSAADLLSTIHPIVERPEDVDAVELAAWLQVTRALLNLDETIHRG
jgi:hypothetical protein